MSSTESLFDVKKVANTGGAFLHVWWFIGTKIFVALGVKLIVAEEENLSSLLTTHQKVDGQVIKPRWEGTEDLIGLNFNICRVSLSERVVLLSKCRWKLVNSGF